jgi:uncharacterized membrane protein YsdA (DUF1294 family)/cold shock CspA family protein
MEPSLRRGKLAKWKDDRGFGFIQPIDGSQEVFLHISELKDSIRRPQLDDTIYYYLVKDENGKIRASNAFILGARNKSTPALASSSKQTKFSSDFPILEVVLLSILPLAGSLDLAWKTRNPLPLFLYPGMSLWTFALYADDKSRAKREDWRIPENTLHLCELLGGWLGGFVAQRKLRHKSIKRSYQIIFWTIVALHLLYWLDWLFLGGTIIRIILGNSFGR